MTNDMGTLTLIIATQWSYTDITKNMKSGEMLAILNLYPASALASRFYLSPNYGAH